MPDSSAPTEATVLRLRAVESAVDGYVGRELRLDRPQIWIGRAEGNDVVLGDPSLSRRHARFEQRADGIWVVDNQSANGVFLDDRRVAEAPLAPGQRLTIGGTTFLVLGALRPELAVAAAAEPAFDVDKTARISDILALVAAAAEAHRPKKLEEEGEPFVTAANRPLLLDDPEVMYVVESGKVEIFTVAVENRQPVGARTHFLTVEPGQAFFGLDTERLALGSGFLAVGKAGSGLRRYTLDRLQVLAGLPAHGEPIAQLVATWVSGLSRRLTQDVPNVPAAHVLLAPGAKAELPVGKLAGVVAGVAWIEMPAARFLFDGMASLSWEVEGVCLPLAPGSWLELLAAEEPVVFEPRATPAAIADSRLWAGLDIFHRLLCECEFLNKKLALADEFVRLEHKAEQVERAREVALGAIGSVLGGTGIWERPAVVTDAEPIFRACALVGAAMGLPLKNHPDPHAVMSFEETILAIATASRCRTRKVALTDDWWRRDQGPMLGQREAGKAPVALLPKGPNAYELVDPTTDQRVPLTEELVRTLEPFAYTFYRPFPDGVVKARDLVQFSMRGLAREFRSVALMGICLGFLGTLTPLITGRVFDTAIPEAERGLLYQFGLGLFMVALGSAAFKITQNVAMLRVQSKMDYGAQSAVWDRLLDLPLTFFRKFSSGDLADRAAGVDQIRAIVAGAGVSAILGSLSSLFNAVQMLTYSFALAGVAIALTLAYVCMTTGANYAQLRFQRDEARRRGKITGLVLQLISGVAKLRVSGAENHAFRVWATDFAAQRKVSFKVGRVRNVMAVVNNSFPLLSSMGIFYTMSVLAASAAEKGETFQLTTGDFLAFNAAYGLFLGAMQALGDASLSMLKVVPIYERLKPILEALPEVDGTKAYPGRLKGSIEVAHVSFRYSEDGPWILKDVSLKIQPGEFVALVGGSGSGKSTLMRVILGFERPEKGSVYYDGQDLSTLDVRMVRAQLGVVLQESRLLPADIYRNIVGASSHTIEDAWDAARKSGLADDVKAMPMGMHTYVSEGGGGFSGGQKQRLMIARAVVHSPKILFLDEATSALDNRTQKIVTESMNALQSTRVVIAHRLSTVVDANRICYLDQGQLVEQGTFAELMEKDGLFAQLAKRQMA